MTPTWPPAPLHAANESPGVRALGGSQSAAGVGPGLAEVMLVSASPPPLPALTGLRDDKLTPLSSSPGLGGTPGETVRHCSAPEDPIFRFSSLHSYPFPGTIKSWDMSRKRHHLIPETFGVKRRRKRGPVESDPLRGEPGNHGNPGGGASLPVAESFVRTASPPQFPVREPIYLPRVGARGCLRTHAAVPARPV